MGDRYLVPIECPGCQVRDEAYYAPTCGFVTWVCVTCGAKVDLEKLTGITYEDASNREEIQTLVDEIVKHAPRRNV